VLNTEMKMMQALRHPVDMRDEQGALIFEEAVS
jgi:hypothetical protein